MKNYTKVNVGNEPRTELHDLLGLTGAEVSFNNLPAGVGVPFVHSHKNNEEIYIVLEGKGTATLADEMVTLNKGDVLRILPSTKRQFKASDKEGITYICIQVKADSLKEYTATDAVIY